MLYNKVGNNFKFIFAAKGKLKHLIDKLLISNPELNDVIHFDYQYKNWNDRLIPFSKSDV